ncbi:MAG: CHASE2 domain-containing protein, partial [Parvibaculaceae bacterium]
ALPRFRVVTPIVPELEAAAKGIGTMSLSPGESSGAIRQLPLLLTDGKQAFPSLTLEALRVAQDASTFIIRGAPDRAATIEDIRIGDYVVPTTESGELWLYYRPESRDLYISVKDILEETDDARLRDRLEGHIVLVGTSATGLFDLRSTALGETVPGVAMHAQALEQILAGTFLWRPDWSYGAEVLAIVLMGLLIIAATLLLGPLSSFAVGAIAAIFVAMGAWALFRNFGLLLDPSFVLFSGLVVHLCMTAYRFLITDRTARAVSRAFAHYVSPPVLAQIQKQPDDLKLGGEVRDLTIMFLDIRNFTPISESLSPEELIAFLNRLLGEVSRCIVEEDGTIDKYIGDSVMAFWNAPVAVPDHPRRACVAALRMREATRRLNGENAFGFAGRAFAFETVGIGVGLNTGPACVGNMGSEERFNYSCVGDAVNLSARVESACKEVGFDLVIAGATADAASDFALLYAGSVPLKGKSQRQPLYLLAGGPDMRQSETFAGLAALHLSFIEALGRGDDPEAERLAARCRETGEGIVPLQDFYAKAFGRLDDFRPAPVLDAPAAEAAE